MTPLTRKQREIRDREELLLDVAAELLVEQGYLGLTMDKLAARTEYSKGTLYQHFSSKEDVVAGILARNGEMRAVLFERAATFLGSSRERMGAVGAAAELFVLLYPHYEQAERLVKTSSIRAKAKPERVQLADSTEFRCFSVATGVVRDAVGSGDLVLPEEHTVEQITMGLWSLYSGAFMIRELSAYLDESALDEPVSVLLRNHNLFLDGAGWQPLSTEHDYFEVRERALREIFPAEAKRAGLIT